MSWVPPRKVMAHFSSLPAAFILAKASLSGELSILAPVAIRSLATEIAWPLVLRRARMYIGTGLFSGVVRPSEIW